MRNNIFNYPPGTQINSSVNINTTDSEQNIYMESRGLINKTIFIQNIGSANIDFEINASIQDPLDTNVQSMANCIYDETVQGLTTLATLDSLRVEYNKPSTFLKFSVKSTSVGSSSNVNIDFCGINF